MLLIKTSVVQFTKTSITFFITWHQQKKHEILIFDLIIEYKLECASPLQQNDVRNDQLIHRGLPHAPSSTCS
jgi:hypothetical protein